MMQRLMKRYLDQLAFPVGLTPGLRAEQLVAKQLPVKPRRGPQVVATVAERWRQTRSFLQTVQIRPVYFVVPVVLSLAAALCEGVSISLLIPFIKGVITQDYSFIRTLPYLGPTIQTVWPAAVATNGTTFVLLVSTIFVSTLLKIVLRYLSDISNTYISRLSYDHLRRLVFDRYLRYGKLFFDRHNVGYLNQVLMSYTQHVTKPIDHAQYVINALFSLLVYVSLMVIISLPLTLFVLCVFPVTHFLLRSVIRAVKRKSEAIVGSLNRISQQTFNILSSIPLVMLYSRQAEESRRFAAISNEVAHNEFLIISTRGLLRPVQDVVTLFALVLLVGAMAWLTSRGRETNLSSFLVYFYLVMNATGAFSVLHRFRGALAEVSGPLDEIRSILSEDDDKAIVPDGNKKFLGLKRSIEFRQLHFSYATGEPVLSNISFSIPQGQMTAIVGQTGAGKSTLINILMRYYDCSPGSVLLDGEDIRSYSLASVRSHLALVSQDTLLFHDTLRNNITYGIDDVTEQQLQNVVQKARLSDLVGKLQQGLETLIGDRGVKLSGGEKQRVAIARALLKGADILLLDEATSSLDTKTERRIQEAIDEAIVGKTAIVIAHRLSTITSADTIVVIENGEVAEAGALAELLAQRGLFYEQWAAQKFF